MPGMQTDLIFRFGRTAFVLLPSGVMRVIDSFTVGRQAGTEAGGILIGSYRGPHVQICDCTVPMRGDVRKAHLFDRKYHGHHQAANSAWEKSSGTETYIGEWHTHPEDFPTPSSTDLRTWSEIMGRHALPVVFLIAGRRAIWAGVGQGGRVERLRRVPGGV